MYRYTITTNIITTNIITTNTMSLSEIKQMVTKQRRLGYFEYRSKIDECRDYLRKNASYTITYEFALMSVCYEPELIIDIPDRLLTEELCTVVIETIIHIRMDLILPRIISLGLLTKEMSLIIVRGCGKNIKLIPKDMIDYTIYLEAIKKDGSVLELVPEDIQTEEMLILAVTDSCYNIKYFKKRITNDLWLRLLKINSYTFEYIPNELKTPEVCILSVKQDICMTEFLPEYMFTPQLCKKLIKISSSTMSYIPLKYITRDMCVKVIEDNKDNEEDIDYIEYIPESILDVDLCRMALYNGASRYSIPDNFLAIIDAEHKFYNEDSSDVEFLVEDFGVNHD